MVEETADAVHAAYRPERAPIQNFVDILWFVPLRHNRVDRQAFLNRRVNVVPPCSSISGGQRRRSLFQETCLFPTAPKSFYADFESPICNS